MPNRHDSIWVWATLRALLALGGRAHTGEIDELVATYLDLTEEDRKICGKSKRNQPVYKNRCGWARTHLHKNGAVVNSESRRDMKPAEWALTERGDWIKSEGELEDLLRREGAIRKESGNDKKLTAAELEDLWKGMGPEYEEENPDEADKLMQEVEQALGVYGGATPEERRAVEKAAMEAVMAAECKLGHRPKDVSDERGIGYDIKSRENGTGRWRRIEVKGRVEGADTVTVTRNEIGAAVDKPDAFILAIVVVANGKAGEPRYVRKPFRRKPDDWAISATYKLSQLLARAQAPS